MRLKEGRSGSLVFVRVRHEIQAGGQPAIEEFHDIVYRGPPGPDEAAAAGQPAPAADAKWSRTIEPDDVLYKRTARGLAGPTDSLAAIIARLCGPDSTQVLEWLRRAPLDGGVAAEYVDGDGRAIANGGDASLAGLLAATVVAMTRPMAPEQG